MSWRAKAHEVDLLQTVVHWLGESRGQRFPYLALSLGAHREAV